MTPVRGLHPRVLIAYDGSSDARRAITVAARLLAGCRTTLLSVWEPMFVRLAATGVPFVPPLVAPPDEVDREARRHARRVAEDGVRLARQAGLAATARWEPEADTVWGEIVSVADEIDAALIVTGTRGLSGVRAMLSGSVARHVVQHAHRPVLVVPPPG